MKSSKHANLYRLMPVVCFSALCLIPLSAQAQVDVLTQHNDDMRTGANLKETILKPANVNEKHFGMLFKHVVDDQFYTQPLIATGIKIGGGWHDVVYVTTVNNSVYAFDANDATESPFWHVNFGAPASLHDADFGCLDMNGNMGIVGTPVMPGCFLFNVIPIPGIIHINQQQYGKVPGNLHEKAARKEQAKKERR